jgi:hypothetical protein
LPNIYFWIDDDCFDTYYDDTDPFQDDNNNNYTTNVNSNDPEQFEYTVSTLKEIQTRFEPSVFSNSYIHTSSSPAICSICFKTQTNFQSLICNHAFCHECWSQYVDTKFQSHNYLSKLFSSFQTLTYSFGNYYRYGMYEMWCSNTTKVIQLNHLIFLFIKNSF